MSWLMENWDGVLLVLTSVIAAASAVAALTPTPKDDGFLKDLRKLLDKLAFNFSNAENKNDG